MKLRLQAQNLQPGDIVGSGEVVRSCSAGVGTPRGKVDVKLCCQKTTRIRKAQWGKYTMINLERPEKVTA